MPAEGLRHVPLVPFDGFTAQQREDFALDSEGAKQFAHMDWFEAYRARAESTRVAGATRGFGGQLNAHMHVFDAWRFRLIREKRAAGQLKRGRHLPRRPPSF